MFDPEFEKEGYTKPQTHYAQYTEEEDKASALENFQEFENKEYINSLINRWKAQGRNWHWIFVASWYLEPELSTSKDITAIMEEAVDNEVRHFYQQ